MLFNVEEYFTRFNFSSIVIYPNIQIGLKYGFIFFLTAMLLGIGLNYTFRLLKF